MTIRDPLLTLTLIAGVAVATARADDWPNWRGPRHDGVSAETAWSDRWPASGPRVPWRSQVGTGYSSLAVAGERLFTLGNVDNLETVHCLNSETGQVLWKHDYPCALDGRFFDGGPTSTPTVDGDQLYTLSRQGDLFCFDVATGGTVWSVNVCELTGAPPPGWGFAGSPRVHEQKLLLSVGEAGAALDKATGALIWKSAEAEAGYATPVIVPRDSGLAMLVPSGRFWHLVDVASGQEFWRHRWLTRFGCNAADAITHAGTAFISSGYNRGSALLRLGDSAPEVIWTSGDMQNQFNSSVLVGDHVYGIDGDTTGERRLKCLELATGKIVWEADGVGSGALMAAGSRLIVLAESGELIIALATSDGFAPTARAQILDGTCWTAPVLANGLIYCRSVAGEVACVDVRE